MGAIDDTDTFATFSNYGDCVEIQAPVSQPYNIPNCIVFETDLVATLRIYNYNLSVYIHTP